MKSLAKKSLQRTELGSKVARILIASYRAFFASFFGIGGACRFHPSCSAYADEAIQIHGFFSGISLTLKRISKCHPFGGCGYDPVPEVQ